MAPHKVKLLLRLAAKSVPPMITVIANSGAGNFLVPDPDNSIHVLEKAIEELLAESSVSEGG